MRDYTLDEYLSRNKNASLIARIETPHKVLKDARPIEVYVDVVEKSDHSSKTYISLFNCGIFVGNSIILDYTLPDNVLSEIGNRMIKELLDHSDFTDLDRELEGKCACSEFENVYKKCDECPKYRYADGHEDSEDDCLGAMYSIPSHLNFWDLEKEIEKEYGSGTDNYLSYMNSIIHEHILDLKRIARYEPQTRDMLKEGISELQSLLSSLEKEAENEE